MNRIESFAGEPRVVEIAAHTLVVGSGAAGLRCAERLAALGAGPVVLVTDRLGGGASNLSGSDKQTYYKMGVAGDVPDSPLAFARTLVAGGLCHGDQAYVEGALSTAAFFHLCEIGVPFPHDALGAYVGYKTDHDPAQRGTSAGPRTSHFMVQRLLERVRAGGVEIHNGRRLARLVKDAAGRVVGALAVEVADGGGEAGKGATALRIVAYHARRVVLAAGGPGNLMAPSVYPEGQSGAHGPALLAGAAVRNFAECQFGLASTAFRWNLSGTYQQVIPRYFSRDADGREHNFLPAWFSSPEAMAGAIFRKGYQWPLHIDHLDADGSSRVDLAVAAENAKGREVFLDFTRDPDGADGRPVDLALLDSEARDYLDRSGARQASPLARLEHMNPDAVRLYAQQGISLEKPLACAVCFQHQNGGLAVDSWWRTGLPGLYAIGESAGTHGVRPGGSALNAGQVGAMRAAEHIARTSEGGAAEPDAPARAAFENEIAALLDHWRLCRRASLAESEPKTDSAEDADAPAGGFGHNDSLEESRRWLQARVMDAAGFLRRPSALARALEEIPAAARRAARAGQRLEKPSDWLGALENEHLLLSARALLETAAYLRESRAGSRGGALWIDESADAAGPVESAGSASGDGFVSREAATPEGCLRFSAPRESAREEIVTVAYDAAADAMRASVERPRPLPDGGAWFESVWADYRAGRVFG